MNDALFTAVANNKKLLSLFGRLYCTMDELYSFTHKGWVNGAHASVEVGDYDVEIIWNRVRTLYVREKRIPILKIRTWSYRNQKFDIYQHEKKDFLCDLDKLPIIVAITKILEAQLEDQKRATAEKKKADDAEFAFHKQDAERRIEHFVEAIPKIEAMF